MREADQIIVTGTRFTDGTVQCLHDEGVMAYEEVVQPWQFDRARNFSLFHVPEDADTYVCIDLDEMFSLGWRATLEEVWRPDTTRARYLYNWSRHTDDSPGLRLYHTKIHSR